MPDFGSNQYPPLSWEPNLVGAEGGLIARPHGRVSSVRVYYAAYYPPQAQWVWVVNWRGRFFRDWSAATEEDAKHEATVAYWDFIEETPGWIQPSPPPPPPSLPPAVVAFRKRIEDWLDSGPTNEELTMELATFQFANPPIFSKEEDALAYCRIIKAMGEKKGR